MRGQEHEPLTKWYLVLHYQTERNSRKGRLPQTTESPSHCSHDNSLLSHSRSENLAHKMENSSRPQRVCVGVSVYQKQLH